MRNRQEEQRANLGPILQLIREGDGISRAGLVERTGLARATIGARVAALLEQGVRSRRHCQRKTPSPVLP